MSDQLTLPRQNPFQTDKPRSQWKPPRRKLRRLEEVCLSPDQYKLCWFELKADGLHVRLKHGRKEKVWPWNSLVNGVNPTGQMDLL